jgi:ABC-type bacteriocin/lantibiotic exporter with double-glycine peptidase domain
VRRTRPDQIRHRTHADGLREPGRGHGLETSLALILDEGTSHLDVETEKAVNAALSGLTITRLVVAHRPETLRAAGRVVSLEGGVARETGSVLRQQQKRSHENVDSR